MSEVYELLPTQPDSAKQKIKSFDEHVSKENERVQLDFHQNAIAFYKKLGDYELEAAHWRKKIKLYRNNKDSVFFWTPPFALAEQNAGQLDSALYRLEAAITYFSQIGNQLGLASAYSGIANLYSRLDDHHKAIKYQLKAIEIFESNGSIEKASYAYLNLSIYHQNIRELSKCLATRKKAFDLALTTKDQALIHFAEYNLGLTYKNTGNLDSAMILLKKAADYYEQQFNPEHLNAVYNGLAHAYSLLGMLDSAEVYMEKTIALIRSGGSATVLSNGLTNFGFILYEKGDYKKGIAICQEAYTIARRIQYPGMEIYCAECLYRNFKGINRYDSALFYHEVMQALEDSLDVAEAQKNALKEELKVEHKKEIKQQKAWSNTLALAIAILILGIVVLIFALRQRRKSIETVAKEKEYLDNLLHNLVHEFRTPLTLIDGPVSDLLKKDSESKLLLMISRNSKKMLELVNQVLDFAKIKAGRLAVKNEITNIQLFMQDVVEGFKNLGASKNISLKLAVQASQPLISIDSDKLYKISTNLISNAIKYTNKDGKVDVEAIVLNDTLKLHVIDNGIGLSSSAISKIFDKFYQVDATTTRKGEGTGLGLAFVKELVELMGGKIKVNSTPGEGSQFSVTLPISKIETSDTPKQPIETARTIPAPTSTGEQDETLPQILIIEDNQDLREYLSYLLSPTYSILEAENGQVGIEMALEHLPDFIITDVMMPIKDGYQVVTELKKDQKTEHIPITVLTAKASFDSKLKGLEFGADDYLPKPFSSDELKLRINNQLKLQRKQWLKYQEGEQFDGVKPSKEHPFIAGLRKKILQQKEESLTAEELAKMVALSRSQLHRKLKSLTGLSATAFVNRIKLETAYEEILNTELTLSEIAYGLGYSDPAYFSKLFKKAFGKSPSELR
jgi:signal transduction histidine kinase/DNA-binding response OmpR family regulator